MREIKLTKRVFVRRAIMALRRNGCHGIHVTYSGFGRAFKEYYGENPYPHIWTLAREGFIDLYRASGGGVIIALAQEKFGTAVRPQERAPHAGLVLQKILSGGRL